jgi:hypothetical protein
MIKLAVDAGVFLSAYVAKFLIVVIKATPRTSEIKQLVESKKTEKKYIRILNDGAIVHHPPQLLMDSAQVSESLTRQTTKVRALSDSAQVSERIDVIVTRANPKDVSK